MRRITLLILITFALAGCDRGGIETVEGEGFVPGDGRWAIINYWAVWCAPCREEVPELNSLARELGDRVRVFGVNFDGMRGAELRDAARELGIEFTLLLSDPSAELGYPRPTVLPTTIIVSPGGQVSATLVGPQTADSLRRELQAAEAT